MHVVSLLERVRRHLARIDADLKQLQSGLTKGRSSRSRMAARRLRCPRLARTAPSTVADGRSVFNLPPGGRKFRVGAQPAAVAVARAAPRPLRWRAPEANRFAAGARGAQAGQRGDAQARRSDGRARERQGGTARLSQ